MHLPSKAPLSFGEGPGVRIRGTGTYTNCERPKIGLIYGW